MCRPFSLWFWASYGRCAAMSERARYIPPEWAPHAALWVGWPYLRGEWGDAFTGAREEIAAFVRAVSDFTPIRVACGSREAYGSAWTALEDIVGPGRLSLHTRARWGYLVARYRSGHGGRARRAYRLAVFNSMAGAANIICPAIQ
jgi:hypothetical protein